MNKPNAVHRDSLKPRYEYDTSSEDALILNVACPSCGKRRYDPLGPKAGYVGITTCTPCESLTMARARARKAKDAEKNAALEKAKVERRVAARKNRDAK